MPDQSPEQFADSLERAIRRTPKATVAVVHKGAGNVKRDARRNVQVSAPIHSAHAQNFINYDVDARGVEVVAEVGYDRDAGKRPGRRTGPGGLGNILEYGSENNPAHTDLGRALEVEAPRFADALAAMGEDLVGK